MDASIVVRTFNEAKHLPELMEAVRSQKDTDYEIVLVDSGSTDGTLEIARDHGAREVFISKEDFSFGRSLNYGCDAARGDHLIFISGHCIPASDDWLSKLIEPLRQEKVSYSYGRQIGGGNTKYSEKQLFSKYFPEKSVVPQDGFFCNNANAALSKVAWREHPFNEEVTGLEDMELAKRLQQHDHNIGYIADAAVRHLHDETWRQVKWRYEREAIALQKIMPEVHVSFLDFIRYFTSGILMDWGISLANRRFHKHFFEIIMFRMMQYWGAYRGNHHHRRISREMKEKYFYPRRPISSD